MSVRKKKLSSYYWLIFAGVLIFVVLTILFLCKTGNLDRSQQIDTQAFDAFGSMVGGIIGVLFSLASILLLIHTIKEQEVDLQKQKIESRFFELLKIHRANCSEISLVTQKGRDAATYMLKELLLCHELAIKLSQRLKREYREEDLINIAYVFFFFGHDGEDSWETLREYLRGFDEHFVNEFIFETMEKRGSLLGDNIFCHPLFSGHQLQLGHYFRHLFQTINYINKQPRELLSYDDKYEYIKTLRAQLSTQEQVIFFFNSMSILGEQWEKKYETEANKQLITKYNLIKNIPKGYIPGINIAQPNFYSLVEYENQPFPSGKEILKLEYW